MLRIVCSGLRLVTVMRLLIPRTSVPMGFSLIILVLSGVTK